MGERGGKRKGAWDAPRTGLKDGEGKVSGTIGKQLTGKTALVQSGQKDSSKEFMVRP